MDTRANLVRSAVYAMAQQFALKLVTFCVNAWLVRVVSVEVLGLAHVRLTLLYTTATFLAREPFRRAGVREEGDVPTTGQGWARLVNTLWLCPLLSVPVGLGLVWVWLGLLETPSVEGERYAAAVWGYAASVWLESLAEPLWVLGQQAGLVGRKATLESAMLFSRCLLTAGLLLLLPALRLHAFTIAMVASSTLYTTLYFAAFVRDARRVSVGQASQGPTRRRALKEDEEPLGLASLSARDLFPRLSAGLDPDVMRVAKDFAVHGLVKQLLTDGERFLMTFTGQVSLAQQGVYEIVHNLGSLVARLVFAPLEQSAHTFFSQNLRRGKPASEQEPERFRTATTTLHFLLKTAMLFGLTVSVFGFVYARLALWLYAGDRLLSGVDLLRLYSPYVLLLSLNGITESFLFTIATSRELHRHKVLLAVTCVLFVLLVAVLSPMMGTLAYVVANCANMALRVSFSCVHIARFFGEEPRAVLGAEEGWELRQSPLWALVPKAEILFTLLLSGLMSWVVGLIFGREAGVFNVAAQIGPGALAFFYSVLTVYRCEPEMAHFIDRNIMNTKQKPE